MSKKIISATVDERLLRRVDRLAKRTERKRSWLISKALEAFLERVEHAQNSEAREATETYGDPVSQFIESERLFEEARELNPTKIRPLVKSFDSFEEYEAWKNEQDDPWYR